MKKKGEYIPQLETINIILVYCNLGNNIYQHDSKVSNTFIPNKLFEQLFKISTSKFVF